MNAEPKKTRAARSPSWQAVVRAAVTVIAISRIRHEEEPQIMIQRFREVRGQFPRPAAGALLIFLQPCNVGRRGERKEEHPYLG